MNFPYEFFKITSNALTRRTVIPYHGSIIMLFLNSYGIPAIVVSNNHNCAVQKSSGVPHATNQKGMEKHKE
ncbi:uncharacterized protein IAS62_000804 [Cryptococcus decagattii]|uniref:Uncharacterized protein n=1 Tax=Cryptococcus decagattii TaxID=1859122 RepID=A0ABZ2APX6_9TREE